MMEIEQMSEGLDFTLLMLDHAMARTHFSKVTTALVYSNLVQPPEKNNLFSIQMKTI